MTKPISIRAGASTRVPPRWRKEVERILIADQQLARRIRQLARGLYDYPREHNQLGTLAPDTDAVAKALTGRDTAFGSRMSICQICSPLVA